MKFTTKNTGRPKTAIFAAFTILFALTSLCQADTFRRHDSNEVLHGYATSRTANSETIVHTEEKGLQKLNLAQWDITFDAQGRKNQIVVFTLDGPIMLQLEVEAFENAIVQAADKGPLFILLEIDTPGGDISLAQRYAAAITGLNRCPIIAFVKGGEFGGAISAGVAVTFACDKVYMAQNSVIGGATVYAMTESGPKDLRKAYGQDIGEKFSSIWRANLASLAEQNGRSGLLAKAMIDKDIEVIEVASTEKRLFIEPVNKTKGQQVIKTWSKKDSLLTLTAEEAIQCKIADHIANSREELLVDLDATDAEIIINDRIQKATKEFEKVQRKFDRVAKSIDLKIKYLEQKQERRRWLKLVRELKGHYKAVINLAKRYPDLHLDIDALEAELNSLDAYHDQGKRAK